MVWLLGTYRGVRTNTPVERRGTRRHNKRASRKKESPDTVGKLLGARPHEPEMKTVKSISDFSLQTFVGSKTHPNAGKCVSVGGGAPNERPKDTAFVGGRVVFADPAGVRLDNTGVILPQGVSVSDETRAKQSRRRLRHGRRAFLWSSSSLRSIRACGRSVVGSTVGLRLTAAGNASIAGLQTCGSHACPVCAAAIAMERQKDLSAAVRSWEQQGGHLLLLTLTMRHKAGDDLAHSWNSLSYGFGAVSSGRAWVADREKYGVVGFVRAVELMVKPVSGWKLTDEHLHTHILLFVRENLTDKQLDDFKFSLVERWTRALERKGLTALPVGQDLRKVSGNAASLGQYFTKQAGDAVAMEMTQGANKTAKKVGSVAPFVVLDIAQKTNDAYALRWWNRYEKIQRGRRRLLWSRGLRSLLALDDEKTDDEIAAEDKSTVSDTVAVLTPQEWKKLTSTPYRIPLLLDTLERFGVAEALRKLTRWGIEWSPPSWEASP